MTTNQQILHEVNRTAIAIEKQNVLLTVQNDTFEKILEVVSIDHYKNSQKLNALLEHLGLEWKEDSVKKGGLRKKK